MKRIALLFTLALGLASTQAFAQELKFGFGAEMALPQGDFEDAGTAFGGSLRLQAGLNDKFSVMGTAGALLFEKQEVGPIEYRAYMIPIQAGLKFYLFTPPMVKVYTSLEGGVHIAGFSGDDIDVDTQTLPSGALGLGVQVKMVDFGVKYQLVSKNDEIRNDDGESFSQSYIGFRLGLMFGPSL